MLALTGSGLVVPWLPSSLPKLSPTKYTHFRYIDYELKLEELRLARGAERGLGGRRTLADRAAYAVRTGS